MPHASNGGRPNLYFIQPYFVLGVWVETKLFEGEARDPSGANKEVINILEGAPQVSGVERSVAEMGVLGKDSHSTLTKTLIIP